MEHEMRKYIDTFKQKLTESENFVSFRGKADRKGKFKYDLVDTYETNESYMYYKKIISDLSLKNRVEKFIYLHDVLNDKIGNGDFSSVRKIMNLFNDPETDVNILKCLLISTSPYRENINIHDIWVKMDSMFEKIISQ